MMEKIFLLKKKLLMDVCVFVSGAKMAICKAFEKGEGAVETTEALVWLAAGPKKFF